jgi:CheY-like chemotaxis protein
MMSDWNVQERPAPVCLDLDIEDACRIGVMEENESHVEDIRDALESRGFSCVPIPNPEKAVFLAEVEHLIGFILDVNMGEGREQEGLDTLDDLKSLDRDTFVVVYSTHPDLVEKAIRSGADFAIEKTKGAKADLGHALACYRKKYLQSSDSERDPSVAQPPEEPETDPNYREYCALLLQRHWRDEYSGMFVGFVDGAFVAAHSDRVELIRQLRLQFPRKLKFVIAVDAPELDVPTPLEVK